MTPNKIFENSVVGLVVTTLLDEGMHVLVGPQDGMGMYIYATGDALNLSGPYDMWVLIMFGNEPSHLISDYSTNLEEVLAPVRKFCDSLEDA